MIKAPLKTLFSTLCKPLTPTLSLAALRQQGHTLRHNSVVPFVSRKGRGGLTLFTICKTLGFLGFLEVPIKKSASILIIFLIILVTSGYTKPNNVYVIDAERNAIRHNSIGLNALSEGNYSQAIQEFYLAIALNPKTQATSVYYNNLGETYMRLGYFKEAQKCFESSMTQYNLNFLFYQNLVKSFKAQKIIPEKIKIYKARSEKYPLSMIVLGLLYVENGDVKNGIIKLDEYCMKEPNLLITSAVRNYIEKILPKD